MSLTDSSLIPYHTLMILFTLRNGTVSLTINERPVVSLLPHLECRGLHAAHRDVSVEGDGGLVQHHRRDHREEHVREEAGGKGRTDGRRGKER